MSFEPYLAKWRLQPDGAAIVTPCSELLPVLYQGQAAMLKIAKTEEEQRGSALLLFWQDHGAVKVFLQEGSAILMERAQGHRSLIKMAEQGQDTQATHILCDIAHQLHQTKKVPIPSTCVPLTRWFRALETAAIQRGGLFSTAWTMAEALLQSQQEITVLHGDIHHSNVLDFGDKGWRVIDPKGLVGERAFDFANIFCNPNFAIATRPYRLEEQAALVAKLAKIDYHRLLQWIMSYAALSAAWHLEDNTCPDLALAVTEIAYQALTQTE